MPTVPTCSFYYPFLLYQEAVLYYSVGIFNYSLITLQNLTDFRSLSVFPVPSGLSGNVKHGISKHDFLLLSSHISFQYHLSLLKYIIFCPTCKSLYNPQRVFVPSLCNDSLISESSSVR